MPKPPVVVIPPLVTIPPVLPVIVHYTENFFQRNRPGQAVVRPVDMLALRFELRNLSVAPGTPPRLRKDGKGQAVLVVHFPPQSFAEQAFFETRPGAPGTEKPEAPPVRARIAGESRLAFNVPDDVAAPYTLEGLLALMQSLAPAVSGLATPQGQAQLPPGGGIVARIPGKIKLLERALLASVALRNMPAAPVAGGAVAARRLDVPGMLSGNVQLGPAAGSVGKRIPPILKDGLQFAHRLSEPRPDQTAIELPWRLILSPHSGERWMHNGIPATSPLTHRTELWHSRLVAPGSDGSLIQPPLADPKRTVRAVWALAGEGSVKPMPAQFPDAEDLPQQADAPFRIPLTDADRYQIAHLSSGTSSSGYQPQAIQTRMLMLSSLGAWLDARGAWFTPPGFTLEEWVNRGTMGRDHYVKVVYKGLLFPFGHQVSLVKVSERKFHNGARGSDQQLLVEQYPGNTAYLRQRIFLVVRERDRLFDDPALTTNDGKVFLHRQFPFTQVRLLTETTPNLDQAKTLSSDGLMFWPSVDQAPFRFECQATDLDGQVVRFSLPMIFIDNSLLNRQKRVLGSMTPDYDKIEGYMLAAAQAWREAKHAKDRSTALGRQRVTLAPSLKSGDTRMQVDELVFDAVVEKNNAHLRAYSKALSQALFYPCVAQARIRIPALSQLTGSLKTNTVKWNAFYLKNGFSSSNQGQVYVDVLSESDMAVLDFSAQGNRSGGFVQPNLRPAALSRLAGPVTGNVQQFILGNMNGADAFPASSADLPLPLLFGCIPLGEVIDAVSGLAGKPEQIPRFASEASTQAESFINDLVRLFDLVERLAGQPAGIAGGAVAAARATLQDLIEQTQAYPDALVANARAGIDHLLGELDKVSSSLELLADKLLDGKLSPPASLPAAIAAAQAATANLRVAAQASAAGVSLPAGLRQGLLQAANVADALLLDAGSVVLFIIQGNALYSALGAIVGQPDTLGDLLQKPSELGERLKQVKKAMTPLRVTVAGSRLLAGAPRQIALDAIDAVLTLIQDASQLLNLLEMLVGDELTVRFDWNPPIKSWSLTPGGAPLFRVNDKHGFLVAVSAKVKKNGQSAPKISVVCSLKNFDLVLIAPASFIELNFEKIEFRVDSSAKMDVDVLLNDIKFVGPLSFVETLRDLIPLDGFSDPPYLDISPKGIDAGFEVALPSVAIGIFNLSNLSLGAGFSVPFIGQPLAVRFNFCSREQPFNLSVCLFGGGGFFGITLDPSGIQVLEAAFEFGASISINLGVASGGVHVMAGVYFRMEKTACSLTGYFRLGGSVSVLGLITASIELYLDLHYEFESGKCVGRAQLTIEIQVFLFSGSVTVHCERKFAGSNGDPYFRDLMGLQPDIALSDELAQINNATDYAWREYVEAFA
ncbi:hypothetical protein H0A66_15855 [Alcaligenaceae bacterium]|nr:hypothetical protein [Alcaligenaceae bacterium]